MMFFLLDYINMDFSLQILQWYKQLDKPVSMVAIVMCAYKALDPFPLIASN